MGRELEFTAEELVIRLTGLEHLAALKEELHIPYAAIQAVSAGDVELPPATLRLGGTMIPFTDIHEGRFWSPNHGWSFLSYEDARKTVTLTLDGRPIAGRAYRAVVVGVDDPEATRTAILARCPQIAT